MFGKVTLADLIHYIISGLSMGGVYALMALGWQLIYATTNMLNFAYGMKVVLGGLIAYTLITRFQLPFLYYFPLVLMIGWISGLLFNKIIVRPLREKNLGAIIIGLYGIGIAIDNANALIWGKDFLPFPPFTGERPIVVLGAAINPQSIWVFCISLAAALITKLFLEYTSLGRALRATANNPIAARLVGCSPNRVYAYTFGIAVTLAFLGGMIIAPITFAGGPIAITLNFKGLTAAILGGLSSPMGAVTGGFILGVTESLATGVISSAYRDVVAMGILVLTLLLKPEGLFGRREI